MGKKRKNKKNKTGKQNWKAKRYENNKKSKKKVKNKKSKNKKKSKKAPFIENKVDVDVNYYSSPKVDVNCNFSPDIDVNCDCNCGNSKSSSSPHEAESKKSQGVESKASKNSNSSNSQNASSKGNASKGLRFNDIVSNITEVATKASNIGLIVADVAKGIGSSILDLTSKTAEASSEIVRISEETGLSTTQLQELKYVASQTGVEFSNIEAAALTMNGTLDLARQGNNAQAEAFQSLGVSLEDAQGNMLSTDEIFSQVIMKLGTMADETERNALATEIFGSNATELSPLLEAGGEGLQNYKDRAHELGLVMSDEVLNSNANFADSMANMKETMGNIKSEFDQVGTAVMNQIGTALIPILQGLFDWVLNNMPMIQEIAGTVFGFISDSVGFLIDVVKNVIDWVKEWAANNEETLNGIKEMFTACFEAVKSVIEGILDFIGEAIGFFIDMWKEYGDEIMAVLGAIWDVIVAVIQTAINIITDIFNIFVALFKGDWEGLWNGIKQFFSNIWKGIGNIIDKYIGYVKKVVTKGLEIISGVFSKIWGGIKDFVTGIWDGIVSGIKGGINWVIGGINGFIKAINSLKIKVPEVEIPIIGKVGGFTIGLPNIPTIPLLAQGGLIARSGLAIVGEKGPELLQLPRGAAVFSNKETRNILGRGGITQNVTINSPSPLSPSLIKRKTLEASRQLAMEWGV